MPYCKKVFRRYKANNQVSVLYSYNDLFGIWERDKLGNWLFQCVPNGRKSEVAGNEIDG